MAHLGRQGWQRRAEKESGLTTIFSRSLALARFTTSPRRTKCEPERPTCKDVQTEPAGPSPPGAAFALLTSLLSLSAAMGPKNQLSRRAHLIVTNRSSRQG
eukprot:scaffold122051_cov66-Phaeocystis_antarctica.AAC.2